MTVVEIQAQQVVMQPRWRDLIDDQVARLERRYPRLIRIHVTLKHGRHHLQGAEQVDILASVPGRTVRIGKQEEEMAAALHAAFEALERELDEYYAGLRGFGKPPGARPQGIVVRVFPERGYGFISVGKGEEVYFHRNALHGLEFETLEPGQPVELEVEQGERGPQASRVFPVGERWTA